MSLGMRAPIYSLEAVMLIGRRSKNVHRNRKVADQKKQTNDALHLSSFKDVCHLSQESQIKKDATVQS